MCRTLVLALLLTSTVQGAEQVVWQIGRPDQSHKEGSMPPVRIQSVSVAPTPLLIRHNGEVRRVIDVAVATTSPGHGPDVARRGRGADDGSSLQAAFALRLDRRGGGRARFAGTL